MDDIVIIQRDMKSLLEGLEKLGKELEIQEEKIMWLIEQLDILHGC